ncbi:hypothetical protein FB451DRAFT_1220514 [Mycena latifolia]|nr:hypothetical protein FB451DRAFT_1220514 [Mycena latifolia]
MDHKTSQAQLIVSTLLGISALIPSAPLRYAALGITICLALIYAIYLKHLSTKLRQLQIIIGTIEATIRSAKVQCPRDQITLTEEWVRLMEVERVVSKILCHVLEMERMAWRNYLIFSRHIAECNARVKVICTTVRLVVEAERQRKLAEEITDAQFMLATVRQRGTVNPLAVTAAPQYGPMHSV